MKTEAGQEQVGKANMCGLRGGTPLRICDMCGEYPLLVVHSGIAHGQCLISSITLKQGGCQTGFLRSQQEAGAGIETKKPAQGGL